MSNLSFHRGRPVLSRLPRFCTRQGSRVAFSNLHYHIFLGEDNAAAASATAGSNTTATIATGASTSGSGSINGPSCAAGKPDAANTAVSKQVVPGNDKEAHVLKGISGVVSPGQMMAILGESRVCQLLLPRPS